MEQLLTTKKSFLSTIKFDDEKLVDLCVNDISDKLNEYPEIIIMGRICRQGRHVGFFSNTSEGYTYSGQIAKSKPLTDNLLELLNKVNTIFNSHFNGILVNKYVNGYDYIGAHSDDETYLDEVGVVSLSYGANRIFRITHKKSKKIYDFNTESYYLYHMGGDFQKQFKHEIPKQPSIKDMRISFTFRHHIK